MTGTLGEVTGTRAQPDVSQGRMLSPKTLEVEDLRTHFFTKRGVVKAVDGVSLEVASGEVLGLVGESGCGKTITGFSIIGLVDPPGRIVSGALRFKGEDLARAGAERMRALRGDRIAMIFQDPMMTLNPVLRVDTQMVEAVQAHHAIGRGPALALAREALVQVGMPAPERRLRAYPHELSGGMRQRIAIAIAFLNKPDLIIADEPTTALDVTIQAQILHEVQGLCRRTGTAMIWITHDLAVVSALADRIAVMYAGRIVEAGRTDEVIDRPLHPYTRGLIGSVPSHNRRGARLAQIPGMPPSLANLPAGCAFRPRCERASERCRVEPDETHAGGGRLLRCFHPVLEAVT
jgi:peptide/nickel transport system ATP-binding protein